MMAQRKEHFIGWVVLLCVFGVCVAREVSGVPADQCGNGITVVRAFDECAMEEAFGTHGITRFLWGEYVVRDLIAVLPSFCGEMMPAVRKCFADRIKDCTDDQQQKLKRMSEEAGYFCTPKTTQPNPAFTHVLNSLSEAELNANEQCESEKTTWQKCDDQAIDGMDRETWLTLSVQDLVPELQRYYQRLMECTVRETAQTAATCSGWRGVAIHRLTLTVLPWAKLGVPLPFTQEQLMNMLQLQNH